MVIFDEPTREIKAEIRFSVINKHADSILLHEGGPGGIIILIPQAQKWISFYWVCFAQIVMKHAVIFCESFKRCIPFFLLPGGWRAKPIIPYHKKIIG